MVTELALATRADKGVEGKRCTSRWWSQPLRTRKQDPVWPLSRLTAQKWGEVSGSSVKAIKSTFFVCRLDSSMALPNTSGGDPAQDAALCHLKTSPVKEV